MNQNEFTIRLSFKTASRLREYAEFEVGDTPERAIYEILENFFAEDYELDEQGELLDDGDNGYATDINPDWMNQELAFRQAEQEYEKKPGAARSYKRYHPEMVESGEFYQTDGRTWAMKRHTAEKIWNPNRHQQ